MPTLTRIAAALVVTILYVSAVAPSWAAMGPPPKILALGTSLTAGFQLPQDKGFTAVLQTRLNAEGRNVTVVNAGVSGDTSKGGRERLAWLLDDSITHAIVELGANDALRGLAPEETRANLDAILTALKAKGVKVLLAGMLAPPNMGPDYAKEFNGLYADLAKKHGATFYPFFLDGVAAEPDLNLPDGIHPNEQGTKVIVERILPYVEKLIGEGE